MKRVKQIIAVMLCICMLGQMNIGTAFAETAAGTAKTEAIQSEASEGETAGTAYTETESTEVDTEKSEATEGKSAELEATKAESIGMDTAEIEATEAEPTEVQSIETDPTEAEPTEVQSTEAEPTEVEATDTESAGMPSTEAASAEEASTETAPVETDSKVAPGQPADLGIADVQATKASQQDDLVVLLDPGHGGTDSGYLAGGLQESNLNLQIALACKAELEKYSGVTVYLTRTADSTVSEAERIALAKAYAADVVISIHNNTGGGTGAVITYTAASGTLTDSAKAVADKLLTQYTTIGLAVTPPAGANGDSLISGCAAAGIPAVHIEHAYMDNAEDVTTYLDTAEKLTALGVADATAIAANYGLFKKELTATWKSISSNSSSSLLLKWNQVQDADGYYIYRSTTQNGSYSQLVQIKGNTTLTYTDSNLKTAQTYYYKICAYKKTAGGSTTYPSSMQMSASPVAATKITSVNSYNSTALTVTWDKVKNATGYYLYRKNETTGKYEKIAELMSSDTKGNTVSYRDGARSAGVTYKYRVRAFAMQNGVNGYGDTSATVSGWCISATELKSVVATDAGALQLTWKEVSGTYKYRIYRSTSLNGVYTKIATVSASRATYLDQTVKSGKAYYYKVRTMNYVASQNGYGTYSVPMYGIQVAKASVKGIVSVSSGSLKIYWNKVSGVSGYKVYRSTSKNGTYKKIATVSDKNAASYTDKSLKTGETYYYKVQALNKVNGTTGGGKLSSIASGTPIGKTTIVSVQSTSGSNMKLTWKKVSGASGYEIVRSTSEKGTYQSIAKITSAEQTAYTVKKLETGKKYYYKIRALQEKNGIEGHGSYSKVLAGKTVGTTKITKIKSVEGAEIRITWKAVTAGFGYYVYRSETKNGTYKRVAEITANNTVSYDDKVPNTNKTYYYKIRVVVKNNEVKGYGDWSNIQKGRALSAPSITALSVGSSGGIVLSWTKPGGANGYLIYRKEASGVYTQMAEISDGATLTYEDKTAKSGIQYYYKIKALNNYNGVAGRSSYSAEQGYYISYYEIMGASSVTIAQMVASFQASGHTYPSWIYAPRGAATIGDFATIVYEEATAEGVKAEVLWAQLILETGWLSFAGSMVSAEQCNFGGLGAVDNSGGSVVAVYPDVRTGLRAQTQHLKAYASTDNLNNLCVDTRFSLVTRGTAVYVEWLGIQENPLHRGWASGAGYGEKIRKLISQTKSY